MIALSNDVRLYDTKKVKKKSSARCSGLDRANWGAYTQTSDMKKS